MFEVMHQKCLSCGITCNSMEIHICFVCKAVGRYTRGQQGPEHVAAALLSYGCHNNCQPMYEYAKL